MEEKLSTETFGDRLRAARQRKGVGQEALAAYVSRSRAAINAWENSYNFPELRALATAAELLETSIDDLVWGDDVANGIGARVRKIPPVLRDGLVMRLHAEINKAEEAAKLLPPEMVGAHLKDRDTRVQKFADANLRKKIPPPRSRLAKKKDGKGGE